METMKEFLRQEPAKALEQWKNAEQSEMQVTDPLLTEFAAYYREAAKKKYLYILHLPRIQVQPDTDTLTVMQ